LGRYEPVGRTRLSQRFAAVGVPVEGGEVGAGNFDSNAVAGFEHVGSRADQNIILVDLVRLNRRGLLQRLAEASAKNTLTYINGLTTRMYINQLGRKISIQRSRSRIQRYHHRADDFDIFRERLRGINQ